MKLGFCPNCGEVQLRRPASFMKKEKIYHVVCPLCHPPAGQLRQAEKQAERDLIAKQKARELEAEREELRRQKAAFEEQQKVREQQMKANAAKEIAEQKARELEVEREKARKLEAEREELRRQKATFE